jgi:protein-tyrosine phosphatase
VEAGDKKLSVLMVCMGNICRSPTAEGVLRHKLRAAGLDERVHVASAGTHGDYHLGSPPDRRSQAHALKRGYDLSAQRAQKVESLHFERYDYILAMDEDNLEWLREACPPRHRAKLRLLMAYAPGGAAAVVPDPYYGGPAGFEAVLDLIEQACDAFVGHLAQQLGQAPTGTS